MPTSRMLSDLLRLVILEDWPLKFVCFVLAVLAWFYIDGELTDERELAVFVSTGDLKLPEGIEVSPEMKWPPLRVRVRGPRRRLQYLSQENIRLNLAEALAEPVRGDNPVLMRAEVVGLQSMEVLRVDPPNITVKLLALSRKVLPVQVRRQGEPPAGYLVSRMTSEPKQVSVQAAYDLQAADVVWTEPVDVTNRSADFKTRVRLVPFVQIGDKDVEVRGADAVDVFVEIGRIETDQVFEKVPVRALAPPGAVAWVEPESITVTVSGPPETLGGLRSRDIHLFVEWPAAWEAGRPPGESFPAVSQTVKTLPLPRLTVRGQNKQDLPDVTLRGAWVSVPHAP